MTDKLTELLDEVERLEEQLRNSDADLYAGTVRMLTLAPLLAQAVRYIVSHHHCFGTTCYICRATSALVEGAGQKQD